MTDHWSTVVYALCLGASTVCAALLFRAWRRSRSRLLLWTATGFFFLALNNLALVADKVVFPDVYLWPARQAFALMAMAVFLYGFIWEAER